LGTIINCYWNNHAGNPDHCYDGGDEGCTAIQDDVDYFKGDVYPDNPPMSEWSFPDIWCEIAGDFPALTWEGRCGNCVSMSIAKTGVVISFISGLDTLAILNFVSEKLDSVKICFCSNMLPPYTPEGTNWVHRYYSITPLPEDSSFEATLTLFYNQEEFDSSGLSNESELGLCRYDTSESTWTFRGGTVDTGVNSISLSGVTEFSLWAITDSSNAVGVSVSDEVDELPGEFGLSQNYPNPFNPTTQIGYALPIDCQVKLEIYNTLGQKVATLVDAKQKAGYKTARWNASSFSSGISRAYFYKHR